MTSGNGKCEGPRLLPRHSISRLIRAWLPPVAFYGALTVQSSFVLPSLAPSFAHSDKLLHAVVYLLLCFLIIRALRLAWWRPLSLRAASLYGLSAVVLMGAADEWHQSWVPGRQASVADLFADVLGAALAVALAWGCHWWGSRSRWWEWLKL